MFSVVHSTYLPLLIGRVFLTPASAVADMGEEMLRIGTAAENLIASRAGHVALQLNPQNWHIEVNVVSDIPARLRERRKTQDPRTESLLQFAWRSIDLCKELLKRFGAKSAEPSVSFSERTLAALSGSRRKNVEQLPHRDEHPRHCTVCLVLCNRSYVARLDPFYHDCSRETLCTKCVLNEDIRKSRPNDSCSSVELGCKTAEVFVVEGEHRAQRCLDVVLIASEISLGC